MKKDWTYKKFEDCIENVKYTTKIQSKDYMASGEYPIISQEEELVSGYWNKNEDVFSVPRPLVVFGDHTRVLKYIDFDFVLGADGVKILLPIEELEAKFLYYFLKWYNVPNLGYSRHYKLLKEISIPIPPLSIQRSIVAELDLLHSVISKKKEQLRELDNLAQSLFYQMFGDPITNPIGWEIKKLGEVGTFERGKGISKSDFVDDGVPCVHYGQLHTAFGAYTTKHLACIPESLIDNPRIAHPGDVLLALTSEDVEGSCKSTAWYGDYDIIVGSDAAVYHHNQDGMYISFYTRTEAFYKQKEKYAHGFKVTHISTKDIETFTIPLPPLSLQQSFAAKVSAIEAQKQAITQSIQHTEALLAQRMDNYFS